MELLKLLSASEVFAQIISFLLLFFLLRVFVWKKILEFLDQRKDRIASELRSIEEAKNSISRLNVEYEAKLSDIAALADKKILEVEKQGAMFIEGARKKAYEESQVIIENAKEIVRDELSKAKDQLRQEIVDLVVAGAEEIIEQKLDENQDRKLVEEFIDKIDKP